MVERPDWGPGGEVRNVPTEVETPKSHNALVKEIAEDGDAPGQEVATTEQQKSPAHSTSVRDANGKIIRPDWSKAPVVVHAQQTEASSDAPVPARNEQGQFLAKPEAALRATWQREGGAEQAIAKIVATEAAIMAASPDAGALQNHIAQLPSDIQLVAADHMRLQTGYGPYAGGRKFGQFCDALSPSQFETFHKWWRGLSRADQDAILVSISL